MTTKITPQHLQKTAYIYIRQSTMGQVRHHRESTERQYAFRNKANTLGWSASRIQVLDGDLGRSGTSMVDRTDFKTIVAEVSLGKAGAVFALEASRLARSNADWHRLIEICGITGTLIVDEDGCYDPSDFNDGLLLGLKGTMAQAELHFIRARLQGGKLNKAKKGELRFPLPVGYVFDNTGTYCQRPRRSSAQRDRIGFYYVSADRLGLRSHPTICQGKNIVSQTQLWRRLGRKITMGTSNRQPRFGDPQESFLRGHIRVWPISLCQGDTGKTERCVRALHACRVMSGWSKSAITMKATSAFEQQLKNLDIIEQNRTNSQEAVLSGPAREGLALLQGLLVCSYCGRRLTPRYRGNGGIYPIYECNWRKREGLSKTSCMMVQCGYLDRAVEARVLEIVNREQIDLALRSL